jgi:hypothetical protein
MIPELIGSNIVFDTIFISFGICCLTIYAVRLGCVVYFRLYQAEIIIDRELETIDFKSIQESKQHHKISLSQIKGVGHTQRTWTTMGCYSLIIIMNEECEKRIVIPTYLVAWQAEGLAKWLDVPYLGDLVQKKPLRFST